MTKTKAKWIFWLVVILVGLLIPHVLGIVKTNMVVELAIAAMFAVSLNLLLGSGLMSFGHSLFYGTGAYATALALLHLGELPLIPVIIFGGLASALVALILSPLLVRVTGTALIMLTLALSQLMYVVCLKFREVTKGEDGLTGFPIPRLNIPGIGSLDMEDPTIFYYFTMVVVAICIWLMWFLTKTPFGQIMVGMRDDQERVEHLGFWVPGSKTIVFFISAFFAGVAGALFGLFQAVVAVDSVLHILVSFTPLMAILIGGAGTFIGPILGSAILLLVEELAVTYTEQIELASGLVFILVVLYAPRGAMGLYNKLKDKRTERTLRLEAANADPDGAAEAQEIV